MKVDGVVAETLRGFVALPTPALKRFAHPNLGSVAVLGMVLDSVHILKSNRQKIHKTITALNKIDSWELYLYLIINQHLIPKPGALI